MFNYTTKKEPLLSNRFTLIISVAIVFLFCVAVLFWPRKFGTPSPNAPLTHTSLTQALDDTYSHSFLIALHRVDPERSIALHLEAQHALDKGANSDDLALMVLKSVGLDPFIDMDDLTKAPPEALDRLLRIAEEGFVALSNMNAPHCRIGTYEALANLPEDEQIARLKQLLAYDSDVYQWLLRVARLKLIAVDQGRTSPVFYGQLNALDHQGLDTMVRQIYANPAMHPFARRSTILGRTNTVDIHAIDLCHAAAITLNRMIELPSETKGRLFTSLAPVATTENVAMVARHTFGDSCSICSAR